MAKHLLHKTTEAVRSALQYHFLDRKMTTGLGIAIMGFIAIAIAYLTVLVNPLISTGIVLSVAVFLLFILCILYPYIGFYSTFVVSLFLMLPARLSNSAGMIPTGLIPEYLSYLALLGVITRQEYRKEITSSFWSNTLTVWIMVLLSYYMLQLVNPNMFSKLGWFNVFRKQISFAAFFYMSYCFFNTRKAVDFFTRFWIILSTIEALYACYQQWVGFPSFEYNWLMADPERIALFINGGFVRRFGLLSDPASAGILYASSCTFIMTLALQSKKTKERMLYLGLTIIHFLAAGYTGTRTATLMIVAGVFFYCVLTLYQKRTIIFSVIFGLTFLAFMFAPIYDNMLINRMRSTFEGSKDPSALVRDINRAIAQPYVWSHPIGGGIMTCGANGEMYNPGHFLNSIPPDSAYMQVMMEQGPIGLALMVIFYFIIMRTGIKHYYRVRDDDIQTLYAAHLVSLFSLFAAQFSQLAIGQYPNVLYFYSALALFLKMYQYDSSYQEAKNHHEP